MNENTLSAGESVDFADKNQNTATVSAQDQALLRALHEFIAPHAKVEGKDQKGKDNLDQKVSGPEAAILITELKVFISRLIERPTFPDKIKIAVDSEKEHDSELQVNAIENEDSATSERVISRNLFNVDIPYRAPQTTIGDRLITALRDHVFNKMPIRLLSFEKHDSGFQLTLLERNEIMTLLESKLRKRWRTKYPTLELSKDCTSTHLFQIRNLVRDEAAYAILSHTWLRSYPGEITYSDWVNRRFTSDNAGYRKLTKFCQTAFADHNISLGWMDTICINKDSSSELGESIRSMYKWYQSSNVCIVYLSETSTIPEIHRDAWFTRGWTLQELLAPNVIKFYNMNWMKFEEESPNDKPYSRTSISGGEVIQYIAMDSPKVMGQIQQATTLSKNELLNINLTPFSRRMQLAANREVTREEDMAYSLMGIFDVSIATAYGEGSKRAFLRLLEAILNLQQDGVLDLLNWSNWNQSSGSHILPSHPRAYLNRSSSSSVILQYTRPLEPLTMTSFGLRIPVLLMPAKSTQNDYSQFKATGDYSAAVTVQMIVSGLCIIRPYRLLNSTICGPDRWLEDKDGQGIFQHTFAVFNIKQENGGIYIPQRCIAILLECSEDAGKVTSTGGFQHFRTKEPVVFQMQRKIIREANKSSDDFVDVDKDGIVLAEDNLARHGMQLVIKYL
ncbi:hypothetical protein BDN70DRAFT_991402 [Pholiota conissans]|uniref:Heterokaryon incompatibility domain-containing protein n=1 Tax=Pholiota conissans TaxID=109636 RepID=A0A9P5Z6R8_9AGAR|nr:hypothetical protein BDN70DRAFT_991402 [Pholiota conissans]